MNVTSHYHGGLFSKSSGLDSSIPWIVTLNPYFNRFKLSLEQHTYACNRSLINAYNHEKLCKHTVDCGIILRCFPLQSSMESVWQLNPCSARKLHLYTIFMKDARWRPILLHTSIYLTTYKAIRYIFIYWLPIHWNHDHNTKFDWQCPENGLRFFNCVNGIVWNCW